MVAKLKTQPTDFELTDTQGRKIRLSDYQGSKYVVLVFNRSVY
jgi:peroxiredoxin